MYLLSSVLLKLPVGGLHSLGFGPHTGAPVAPLDVFERLVDDLARGDGDEVRGDRDGLGLDLPFPGF
jgi:hypothetical protein